MKLGVVVLHYQFWPGVTRCLDSLAVQTLRPERVVVVDNASDDGSAQRIAAAYPDHDLVECASNGGYAPGMNAGLRLLMESSDPPDALMLLTHDCRLAPDALEVLATRIKKSAGVGAVGPLLAFDQAPTRAYSAGMRIERSTWTHRHIVQAGQSAVEDWMGRPPHEVDWLDGAAVLLRRTAIEAVGLLDERYFLYYEDVDYSLRLASAGWLLECVPRAVVFHQAEIRSPGPVLEYLAIRNNLLLVFEHASWGPRARHLGRELTLLWRDGQGSPDHDRRKRQLRAWALYDFALRRFGPPRRLLARDTLVHGGEDPDASRQGLACQDVKSAERAGVTPGLTQLVHPTSRLANVVGWRLARLGEELRRRGLHLLGGRPWPATFDELVAEGRVVVGRHLIGKPDVLVYANEPSRLVIGSFASLGSTIILGGDHHAEWVSAFPFEEVFGLEGAWRPTSRGDVLIGSDVWTGWGSTIMSGIRIGNGAVVGAGAVVTHDVRPYAVAVGSPAREVKRRFSDDVVAALERIAWWDWPLEKILEHHTLLRSPDIEAFVERFDPSPEKGA